MGMALRMIRAMRMRLLLHFDGDGHKPAMPHPPLGDDVLGEMMNVTRSAAQQRDLHATCMIEMDPHGGHRQIMMLMMHVGQTLGELPHGVVININQRGDALAFIAVLSARLLHARAGQITNGLGPVVITAFADVTVQFRYEFIIERYGNPLHWVLLPL